MKCSIGVPMCPLSLIQTVKLSSLLFIFSISYSIYCSFHSQPEFDESALSGIKNQIVIQRKVNESHHEVDLAQFQAASFRALSKMAEINRQSDVHVTSNIGLKGTTGIQNAAERNSSNTDRWASQLRYKLQCLHGSLQSGGIFLYHMRKAAGTTIRDMLGDASRRWRIPFYETEGISLNKLFLEENLILVTSLRDPIERIFSLYWYEHVGWFDGVLRETEKCKSLKSWVDGWRDGSQWKNEFIIQNPGSVYVEVENYYVKALSGWIGPAPVGEAEYNTAIDVLDKFDVVFVTEWISQDAQRNAMSALFSIPIGSKDRMPKVVTPSIDSNHGPHLGHEVKGDKYVKKRLGQSLASDKDTVESLLRSINSYDIRLWNYAQTSLAAKVSLIIPIVNSALLDTSPILPKEYTASHKRSLTLTPSLLKDIGIFRPPGHKGPF